MSDLFDNIRPGHTVHYLTPQGQTLKGKVVMNRGTHLVLNAGGKHGRPQVVTPKNFVKSSEGGKVKTALLSNVAKSLQKEALHDEHHDSIEAVKNATTHRIATQHLDLLAKHGPRKVMDAIDAVAEFHGGGGLEEIGSSDISAFVNHVKRHLGEAKLSPAEAKRKAIKRAARNYADARRTAAVNRQSPYKLGEPQMNAAKAFGWVKEDSKDAEGAAERVAKTKKRKKLHELDNSTLASYVTKALADRKKAKGAFDMSGRIWDGERKERAQAKAFKRIDKRTVGIQKAIGKIANNLPAEPLKAHSDSEKSKHGGWSGMESNEMNEAKKAKTPKPVNWQSVRTHNFSVLKSTEGGQPLKHHIMRLAAAGIPARKSHSPYVGHTALEIPAKHERKASKILYGESVYIDEQPINEVSAPGQEAWIKANKQRFIDRYGKEKGLRVLYAKAWKMSKQNEARESEWTANQQLAGQARKPAKGHYLMRDGRRLSGPHSPEDAVREYKKMSDSKGVKIVHVKEAEDKYKKAVMKAVSLRKKAKGNKHVDTEPSLKMPDKGTNAPLEGTHADHGADDAKV